MKPAQRTCEVCIYFSPEGRKGEHKGYCSSLENDVEPWWTGCIRNTINLDRLSQGADMPQKAVDYIKALPEFDAKIFEDITGIK